MKGIECAFIGVLSKDPELKQGKSGKTFANFTCTVASEADPQWCNVICFASVAEELVQHAHKGDSVYVEGHLSLARWENADGEARSGLAVSATKVERLFAIGQSKVPWDSKGPPGNDAATLPIVLPAQKKRKGAFGLFRKAKVKKAPSEIDPEFNDEMPF